MKLPVVHLKKSFTVDMPVSALWETVSNTQRVNQAVGLPPARFTPVNLGLKAEGRFWGIPFSWKERPFEWIKEQVFMVERVFDITPVRRALGGTRMEALNPNQTRVTLFAEVEPRDIFGVVGGPVVFYFKTVLDLKRLYEKIAKNYRAQANDIFPQAEKPRIHMKRLEQTLSKLRQTKVSPHLIERLSNHLQFAHDDEVVKMRPYALAERWQEPRREVVQLFLHATRAGLLDMEWTVLCPNCRITKGSFTNLSELSKTSHCDTCNIEYDVNFDQYVELRFTVNSQVREASAQQFCIAGPFMTPHVLVQLRLTPGQRQEINLPLEAGQYRLRTRPENGRVAVRVISPLTQSGPVEVKFEPEGVSPAEVELKAGMASFGVTNQTGKDLLLMLEQGAWGQQGLSAAEVTAMQEFRDLFSSEVLTPGLGIEIRNLTFLFSDLKDSTAMYERTGDNPAYALVRDHFVILGDAIVNHQGALVKTIGDAVMGVFPSPQQGVAASLQIQAEIARLNAARPEREPLIVKLGLHAGPCIAITANSILDYFGSTVNTAARVQGVSTGGDMVVTDTVYESEDVAEMLNGLPQEQFEVRLKGLSQTFKLYRIWPVPETWQPKPMATPEEVAV